MTVWVRGFVVPEIADVHLAYGHVITHAQEVELALRGGPLGKAAAATLAELRRSYVDFNDGLRAIATDSAIEATRDIRARLAQTQVRPDTRVSPHLRDLIYCAPLSVGALQTGMVGVARVSTLDRAINRNTPGYGTYWRAQEYGTGQGEVPSQVGRILFGSFSGPGGGDLTPPRSQYAGGGGGPHPIFLSAKSTPGSSRLAKAQAGSSHGDGGWGTIGVEIQPRRFIGIGADGAAVHWREQMAALQDRVIDEITATSVA